MKLKKVIVILSILIFNCFAFINVNAQRIKDDNLELEIDKLYIEILKNEWDGEQYQEEILITKEIEDSIYTPTSKKIANENVSINEITAINLNLDIIDMLKENLPEDSESSLATKYIGRLKIDYRLINKNSKFKSVYNVKMADTLSSIDTVIEIINNTVLNTKKDFNEIISNTLYSVELVREDDNNILLADELLNDDCILLSQSQSTNLELTDKDILYYIYNDVDKNNETNETISNKSSLFIDVQTEEGKASIKGLSMYSNNGLCEIYRAKSSSSNYEYVADIKCDGKTIYVDEVDPNSYSYKLKEKNVDIFSKEQYADLNEVYDNYNSSTEEECNSLFCDGPWYTSFFIIMYVIFPFYLALYFILIISFIIRKIKNKKENKKDTKVIKILKYALIVLLIPLMFYLILFLKYI